VLQGQQIVDAIEKVGQPTGKSTKRVVIADCGIVKESAAGSTERQDNPDLSSGSSSNREIKLDLDLDDI